MCSEETESWQSVSPTEAEAAAPAGFFGLEEPRATKGSLWIKTFDYFVNRYVPAGSGDGY